MWPFKRKDKTPAPAPEPVKLQEVPPVEPEAKEFPWPEMLAAAMKLRDDPTSDGAVGLRALFDDLIARDVPITGDILQALGASWGLATNSSHCPCGSGQTFKACCKDRWRSIELGGRAWRTAEADKVLAANQERIKERKDQAIREEVTWLAKIGIGPRNMAVLEPLETAKAETLRTMTDVLAACLGQAQERIIIAGINQLAQQQNAAKRAMDKIGR